MSLHIMHILDGVLIQSLSVNFILHTCTHVDVPTLHQRSLPGGPNFNFLFSLGTPPQIFCSFLDQSNIGQLWTFGYLPNPTKSDKNYYFKCKY